MSISASCEKSSPHTSLDAPLLSPGVAVGFRQSRVSATCSSGGAVQSLYSLALSAYASVSAAGFRIAR